jgi:glycosyltransferase involved in cell wall biosynthesis
LGLQSHLITHRHNMTYVFWQGIISIHQKSFLEAVAAYAPGNEVLLVVEHDITPYRKNMGWEVPQMQGVTIVVGPDRARITELVRTHKDAIHVIGGIKVGAMLSAAFDECIRHKCRVGVMTEPYNHEGWKGMLRTMKYRYLGVRYFRHIQFVLAIGKLGVAQYGRLGFPQERLFPWAYFITVPTANKQPANDDEVRIIYAGRIEAPKGISRFVQQLMATAGDRRFSFDIYGTGSEEAALKESIAAAGFADRITIHPFLKYDELLAQYGRYDWVVLPSAGKDGWGVIVSEGLLNGLKAVCSNICGVSRVITNGRNGMVFDWQDETGCANTIHAMLDNNGFATKETIAKWAQEGISAEAGARYFFAIIDNVYNDKTRPGLPWEQTSI